MRVNPKAPACGLSPKDETQTARFANTSQRGIYTWTSARKIGTSCAAADRAGAERALGEYIGANTGPSVPAVVVPLKS